MKEDKLYQKLKDRMYLVTNLPPQEVGFLTPFWKKAASIMKNRHLTILSLSGFATSLILWFLLGASLVSLASILQTGF